jgi:hypothetical protein
MISDSSETSSQPAGSDSDLFVTGLRQSTKVYLYVGRGKPAHVPGDAVAVPPTRGFVGVEKVGAGAEVLDGAIVVACVDALKRTEDPESLVRVTRTLVNLPESPAARR